MISDKSEATQLSARAIQGNSPAELNERLVNTLKEVHGLLELYAPTWYTEELHNKTVATLRSVEALTGRNGPPQSRARACRESGNIA